MLQTQAVSNETRQKIVNHLKYQWDYNNQIDYTHLRLLFSDCSRRDKTEIVDKRAINRIKDNKLFQNCDDHFIKCVAANSKIQILPPNTEIVTEKTRSAHLYIIIRGFILLNSYLAGDNEKGPKRILTEGDSFAIIECLHNVPVFVTVSSLTSVELLSVNGVFFMDLVKAFPSINVDLIAALNMHLSLNRNILLRLGGRLPPMKAAEKSLGQGDYFTYEIFDDDTLQRERMMYMQPFLKLGK